MTWIDQSLGSIARQLAGATAVFHQHNLDFCCGGNISLRDAAARGGHDAQAIAEQLQHLKTFADSGEVNWAATGTPALVEHILKRFHDKHREQLPELIRLARRVEAVHGERSDCPHGLADLLEQIEQEMLSHMAKEEQILFPLLLKGMGAMAVGPISVMRFEHDQHGENLRRLGEMTDQFQPPRAACTTWRALYLGLKTFRDDLMEHIHLENNILFVAA